MGTVWVPGAERLTPSSPGGMITSTAPPRIVWHCTEAQPGTASVFQSMIRVLTNKGAEPHLLYDPVTDRLGQFLPLNVSGRALRNDGSTRTNRIGKVCIQVEVIAYSSKPFTAYWKPGQNWKNLIAAVRSWGIPDVQPAGSFPQFIDKPPHNVPENPRSRSIWLGKGGHFSHSQVPGNDHGDPGSVSFPAMLAAAASKPVPPKPPVTPPKPVTPTEDDIMALTEQQLADAFEQGADQYNARIYSDKGTLGIWRKQDVAWQAAMLEAANRQADAMEAIAASLKSGQ